MNSVVFRAIAKAMITILALPALVAIYTILWVLVHH
jgi:hypothetical protein